MDNLKVQRASETARRYRIKQTHLLTPEERMKAFDVLQRQAMATLQSNPDALAAFHRRNRHQRRQSNVAAFEAILLRKTVVIENE